MQRATRWPDTVKYRSGRWILKCSSPWFFSSHIKNGMYCILFAAHSVLVFLIFFFLVFDQPSYRFIIALHLIALMICWRYKILLAMRYEQAVFEFPELLRKIHIISVRIFKSLYLTPEKLYLLFAECLYFFEIRRVINELSVFKHLYLEFFASVVSQKLSLPYVFRVEYLIRSSALSAIFLVVLIL